MTRSGQHGCSLNSRPGDECDLPAEMLNRVCASPGNAPSFPGFFLFFPKMNEGFDMKMNRDSEVEG